MSGGRRPGRVSVLAASAWREGRYLLSSPADLVGLLLLPLLAIVVMAAMFIRGGLEHVPIAVVDQDHSSLSRAIVRKLEAGRPLQIAAKPPDLATAFSMARAAKAYLVVLIPQGLEEEALHRRAPAVVLYPDLSFETVGSQAARQAGEAIAAAAAAQGARFALAADRSLPFAPPRVQVTVLGNPQQSFEFFLESLVLPGVLHLLASCACVAAVGRELSEGTLCAWVEASGGRIGWALVGKLLPHVAVFSLWGAVWVAWLAGERGWPVSGSLPVLLGGQALLYAATAAIAALLVAVTRDPDTAFSASTVYAGSAIAYSNGTLPVANGPWFAQAWSALLPFSNYLRLQQQQWVLGAALMRSAPSALVLVLFIAVGLGVAVPLLKRMAKRPPKLEEAPGPALERGGVFSSYIGVLVSVGRSRPLLSLLVLSIVLYGFYYPLAYAGQTSTKLPTAVADLDRTPFSRSLVRDLAATRAIRLAERPQSPREAERLLRDNRVDAVILLPNGLERGVLKRTPGGVGIYLGGAYLVRAEEIGMAVSSALEGGVEAALSPVLAPLKADAPGFRVVEHPLFNVTSGYGAYAVSGVASIILQQTLLFGCATFAAWRRESTPAWRMRAAGFLGCWAAFTTIGCLAALFYFGFIFWFQDYPRGGDLPALLLGALLFAAATSALGLLIGSALRKHGRAVQLLAGTSVPLFFLGGSAWPAFAMPGWLADAAKLFPSTSAIPGFIKIWGDGASLAEAGPELLMLAILTAAYGGLAAARWIGEQPSTRHPVRR